MELTFITAAAPYHAHLIPTVRAQVARQTVACAHIVIEDTHRRGAGWARNQGLAQVSTPLVAFLDADDGLAQTWAAETLAAFEQHGGRRYIYTDYVQDGRVVAAPDCAWVNKSWHVITALIPTAWARRVGGFDETLPAFEDTAFYLALASSGLCGARLARPLFEYRAGGQRSAGHYGTPAYDRAMQYFTANYGGRNVGSCCGDPQPGDLVAVGEHLEGDVMAQATWAGNRPERGRVTGRVYRTGNYKMTWVDPADASARPALWRVIPAAELAAPSFDYSDFADYQRAQGEPIAPAPLQGVEEIAAFFMQSTQAAVVSDPPAQAIDIEAVPSGARPSSAALREKARRSKRRIS